MCLTWVWILSLFPISIIALIIGSISRGLFISISCLVDGLCPIIEEAPSILLSIETPKLTPTASQLFDTLIICLIKFLELGSFPIISKLAPVIALIGLNEQFPHNLIQISSLRFFFCGAFSPPLIKRSDNIFNLSVFMPLGSPRLNLFPSICFITPGFSISHAG